ncbi:MAG: aspartate aminotransferase family protein [Acidobacteria bacterium]|jgi:4-aminobutyrate aminotransferase|nr:aspartate aminotransferase family protein [Acidobacteriota bacterium]MDP7337812.1 acetyl ornithine aminotransferase family protein [Vicinamibacterales bacterium]HJN43145.1 acetyl ornithine aminotransferase family protein [Vicinamibacterales bacterium]
MSLALILEQPEAPRLVTKLPGPRAASIVARDHAVLSPSYTRDYPFVIDHGIGVVVDDPDGNRFLDLNAGIAVCSTGHRHPLVVEAIRGQIDRFLHMSGTDFYYEEQIAVGERLAAVAPMAGPCRVVFGNSGAEATEAAFKLARHHTGRPHVIAFYGAFHGRTLGALSLTASKAVQRRGFLPLVPEVTHVQYPFCYRCDRRDQVPAGADCCGRSLGELEEVLLRRMVSPTEVAAIFVEAVQGEGGYVVPPPSFLRGLRRVCDEHGILLVCDEVQSGMGRTGKMFAVEHSGVEPDIVAVAKGVASGLPLGAVVARAELMHWERGAHASTFGGNPVSCAAALATLDLLEGGLVAHAAEMGGHLRLRLMEVMARQSAIGDVRGLGLMTAVDLVTSRETRQPDPTLRDAVLEQAFQRGVLLLGCGESAIRFSPPLVISRAQIDTAMEIFDAAVSAAVGR